MAALTQGEQYAALDQYTPQQPPLVDERDPYALARDMLRQRGIAAESEIERIKTDKWGRVFNALGAFGAGLQGKDPTPHTLQGRIQPYQDVLTQAQNGMSDLSLQQWQMQQKLATGAEDPAAVREYKYWLSLPEEQRPDYLRVRRDTYNTIGNRIFDTSSGTPVDLMSDEQLQAFMEDRRRAKQAETTGANDANSAAERAQKAEQNTKAYQAFDLGMGSLRQTLSNTVTAPGMGALPALSAEAQAADGSMALMAPLLKDLFRQAGEGTFTKDDQKILLDMLPDRNTWGAARDQKLHMVDSIVRVKLGMPPLDFDQWKAAQKGSEAPVEDLRRDEVEQQADLQNLSQQPSPSGFRIISKRKAP